MALSYAAAMNSKGSLVRARLRTPRAAAIAGIVFSVLLISTLWLIRLSIPSDPREMGAWVETSSGRVGFALSLVPIAGVAFLWFVGVLRDRLGAREDQLFATVFLGSGLLFLGMLFVAAAAVDGLLVAHSVQPKPLFETATFPFVRAFVFEIMQLYAFKMAAVFMVTTSTVAVRTGLTARWIALVGYASAALILLGSQSFPWVPLLFPVWVLLVSVYILVENLRGGSADPVAARGRH